MDVGDRGNAAADTRSTRRWLFADQLGPHFLDAPDQPVLLVEARGVLRRRRFHRQKAHLILSALRHRAADLGKQATFLQTESYAEALAAVQEPLTVCHPTSYAAARFVRSRPEVTEVLPARGFVSSMEEFASWAKARGRRRLLLEDFYRDTRRRLGLLMDGAEPAGGRWNFDEENREPPPKNAQTLGVDEPWWPREDDIDAQVRDDLDRWERDGSMAFVGRDGPRWFPVSREEALDRLEHFVAHRLPSFGAQEDAMLSGDPTMAHSLLSAAMNLGLLDPVEVVHAAEDAYRRGDAPIASVEGFVRQVCGWRDYVWHLYWHLGEDYRHRNYLQAQELCPTGSSISTPTLWVLDVLRTCSRVSGTEAGCTTFRGSWCWGTTDCSVGGGRTSSRTGFIAASSTATTG
jgi:deoxyribodipyrimidine photolyase-related protein